MANPALRLILHMGQMKHGKTGKLTNRHPQSSFLTGGIPLETLSGYLATSVMNAGALRRDECSWCF
jgi:hypothetical protein